MLIIMEDQTKIFTHGLKVWAKIKPKKSQTELGKVVGKTQPTISDYFKGEYYPDMDIIEKWVTHYSLDFEAILQLGRKDIAKRNSTKQSKDIEERLAKIEATLPSLSRQDQATIDITTERHRKVIDKFQNKDLALKLNELLLEIEQMEPAALKEAETTLSLLKIKVEQESAKKRTANGEE